MKIRDILKETVVVDMEDTNYAIPVENWANVVEKIAKLNRKAKKINAPEITLTKIGEEWRSKRVENETIQQLYYIATVSGTRPTIQGWYLIATIDHESAGNILRIVPGETLPTTYRSAEPKCDHCKSARARKSTCVLKNSETGELIQVGLNCVADFLGTQDPKSILQRATWLRDLDTTINDVEPDFSGTSKLIPLELYVANVATMIRKFGWLSRSQALKNEDDNNMHISDTGWKIKPTETTSSEAMSNMFTTKDRIPPTPEDFDQAKNAIEWAANELKNKEKLSDFEYNIHILAKSSFIQFKHTGMAAAIIPAYLRHQTWYQEQQEKKRLMALKRDQERQTSSWVGNEGDRMKWVMNKKTGEWKTRGLELKLIGTKNFDSMYGVSVQHRFVDRDGNALLWYASTDSGMKPGNWYKVDATIKAHDTYNDIKQTKLTRVSTIEDMGSE